MTRNLVVDSTQEDIIASHSLNRDRYADVSNWRSVVNVTSLKAPDWAHNSHHKKHLQKGCYANILQKRLRARHVPAVICTSHHAPIPTIASLCNNRSHHASQSAPPSDGLSQAARTVT